jgi:hypothetical protein
MRHYAEKTDGSMVTIAQAENIDAEGVQGMASDIRVRTVMMRRRLEDIHDAVHQLLSSLSISILVPASDQHRGAGKSCVLGISLGVE